MGSEWEELTLEDSMGAVIDYRGKTPRKTPSGIPLITAKIVKGGRIETPDEFIAEEDYVDWMRRGVPECGDVVVTTEAPLGEVAQLGNERVALAQRLICLRGKPGVLNNNFLKFLMQSNGVQEQLRSRATGTTVLGIKQSELRKVILTLPPFPEQQAIAHILGTLDDKIELNRRMNQTLEEMARAIFQDWFVDFGPTRAKLEGREPYLPPELWDLFPDQLVDSELGEVPEGWEVRRLGELIELAYGRALKSGDRMGGPIPVYGSNGQIGWHNKKLVNGPGIVVGRKGNPGVVTWANSDFFPIDTAFHVITKSLDMSLHFLFYALICQDLPSVSADSAVPGLNRNLAYMNNQLVPDETVLAAFGEQVAELFRRRYHLEAESRALDAQRDALLPKLASGEVRVQNGRVGKYEGEFP